jgi:hypothetical protein
MTLRGNPFATDQEATRLIGAFHRGDLAKEAFTHRAHLAVGLWYLDRHPEADARRLVPEAIRRFNARVGTVESPRGGYHETITQCYLSLIAEFRRGWRGEPSFAARANALAERLGEPALLLRHYSEELLWSARARAEWVPPDRLPMDGWSP